MIYLDHAATSFPKAPGVGEAMCEYVRNIGVNINRSTYAPAETAQNAALELRESLCSLFHMPEPARAIITPGMTWGLNMALKGILRPGDHCIVSSLEHNAVMRPLRQLEANGITFSRIPANENGEMDLSELERLFLPNTRLVAVTHASNVFGILHPAEQIGALCKKHGAFFLLDAAQTAGHVMIDFRKLQLDALCVPGHKGLLGPQGIGALLLSERFAAEMVPLVTGGTGSASHQEEQPPFLPDRFESGTMNIPGIYGFLQAVRFVQEQGVESLRAHQIACTKLFLEGIKEVASIRIPGPKVGADRVGVVSVDFIGKDNAAVADKLETEYGILVRCGLHCAPHAHMTLGTYPQGTVRFSFGYGTTVEDVQAAVTAVRELAE